ncbi:MAG: sacsin N-terminal ATP-binding-like domain-containing protein [Ardenticatenaceae bacterium]
MSSNYNTIRLQNIKEYGEGTRHLAFLGQLYSERTHFIFELLQNAEDARAKRVWFKLYRDRLEVWHDGRPFNQKDVRGVCGIAESTKSDDLNKIGKFGIGFKSVYAYTSSPEVHSANEHFKIEHYVRPYPIAKQRIPSPWTTIFKFPFNHQQINAQKAFSEIRTRLGSLHAHTLLFLRSIREIQWDVENLAGGTYYSNTSTHSNYRWVSVIGESHQQEESMEWLVFERPLKLDQSNEWVKVEVAFKLVKDEKTNKKKIVSINPSQLVVFFPTEKETHLGFLIQGPYRTTPARDNIPQNDGWNEKLIRETARLVCDGLLILKKIGLLTVSALQTMPLREAHFPAGSMFRPFYDEVRTALTEEALLPTDDNSFSAAKYAKLVRSTEFRTLLGPKQLQLLFNTTGSYYQTKWLSSAITSLQTGDLWSYLRQVLKVEEVTPAHFVRHFSASFIEQQSDEWVMNFYRFLADHPSLWQISRYSRPPLLRQKPFVRLEDGTHVLPFAKNKIPNAYLPPKQATSFPIVKRQIAADEQALAFLQALGLKEPEQVDEVVKWVLPKYQSSKIRIRTQEHKQDIKKIIHALRSNLPKKQRDLLISELQKTPFLIASNIDHTVRSWQRPVDIYIRTEELERYFQNNPDARFLANGYHQSLNKLLTQVGIRSSVRITRRKANPKGYVIIKSSAGSHKRGLNGFDPDVNIDGLAHAVTYPTVEKALYIWNHLLPKAECLRGVVESSTRQNYSSDYTTRTEIVSKMGQLLMEKAWLPDQEGEFHKPAELSLDDLPPEFEKNEPLAKELEMKSTSLATMAKEMGIDLEHIEFLKSQPPEFQKLFEEWKVKQAKKKKEEEEEENPSGEFNYRDEFKARFDRPQHAQIAQTEEDIVIRPRTAVSHPARRRDKTAQEIKQQQEEEPTRAQRFTKVPSKRWESKKNEARIFLEEEYQGKCQICDNTFAKRDGRPYFEGLYLVSYAKARWVDRPGNVLCLCATCSAKFQHGTVETEENILSQVDKWQAYREGGKHIHTLKVKLCDEYTMIYFTERHMIDLQELLSISSSRA